MQLVQRNVSLIVQLVSRALKVDCLVSNMLGDVSLHLGGMVKLHSLRHVVTLFGLAQIARLAESGGRSPFAVSHYSISNSLID